MISDSVVTETRTLEQRGLPTDSYFVVVFTDGSERTEHSTNWSALSEDQYVQFGDRKKVVRVSIHPIRKITIHHGELETTISAEDGEDIYQSFTSSTTHQSDGSTVEKLIGRKVGRVKNGVVVEEKFIDTRLSEVTGIKF
jgi:hypothetical protein